MMTQWGESHRQTAVNLGNQVKQATNVDMF